MTYNLIEISSGLSTPVIGFVAAYIAYQQWKTNRDKLKLDLFDKRFAVFHATRLLLSKVCWDGKIDIQNIIDFQNRTSDAIFLFDKELDDYLWDIYGTANKVRMYQNKLQDGPIGDERKDILEKESAGIQKLKNQADSFQVKFSPFMMLNH